MKYHTDIVAWSFNTAPTQPALRIEEETSTCAISGASLIALNEPKALQLLEQALLMLVRQRDLTLTIREMSEATCRKFAALLRTAAMNLGISVEYDVLPGDMGSEMRCFLPWIKQNAKTFVPTPNLLSKAA